MLRLPKPQVWVLVLAAALVVGALVLPVRDAVEALLGWVSGRGVWTGVLLAAIWVPAALLLVPGSFLTLGTGFLLGAWWGTVAVSIGSTLGAAAAFLAGRGLGRDWVSRRVRERPRFQAVYDAVGREGLKVVLLTRLSPLFPYNFLNYAYSLTGVRFRDFLLGSWIGMLPGTVMYAYLGSGARTLAALAAGEGERNAAGIALFGLGLTATVAVAALVARAARRALEERVAARGEAAG